MPLTNDGRQISAPSTRLRRVSPDPMATAAQKALSLYKTILRTGRRWPEVEHRDYIKEEAQRLFRANKSITNPQYVSIGILQLYRTPKVVIMRKLPRNNRDSSLRNGGHSQFVYRPFSPSPTD